MSDNPIVKSFTEGRTLLINKDYKWTSFDVINKMRTLLRFKCGLKKIKIGHAGTLDPLANGLLIICTGAFTKKIDTYQAHEKEYTGTFYLGATTPSFDLETEVDKEYPVAHITEENIINASLQFIGDNMQLPPAFSAKKIDGQRAYTYARRGEDVKLTAKNIFIDTFEITRIEMPLVHFRVVCSKGTYIRALARDFGMALNTGAYLHSLCRTRIGNFHLKDAMTIDAFEKMLDDC